MMDTHDMQQQQLAKVKLSRTLAIKKIHTWVRSDNSTSPKIGVEAIQDRPYLGVSISAMSRWITQPYDFSGIDDWTEMSMGGSPTQSICIRKSVKSYIWIWRFHLHISFLSLPNSVPKIPTAQFVEVGQLM
jgi:hypothetical protein